MCVSPQARLQPHHTNTAPLVSFYKLLVLVMSLLMWSLNEMFFLHLFLSSWQWQHPQFRGHHWQRHIDRQQLRIHGYGQESKRTQTHCSGPPLSPVHSSPQPGPQLASRERALVTHRLSVCLCSSGKEPFHRRPILSHLHHVAVRIGDTLSAPLAESIQKFTPNQSAPCESYMNET